MMKIEGREMADVLEEIGVNVLRADPVLPENDSPRLQAERAPKPVLPPHVRLAQLREKLKWSSANHVELHWMVMELAEIMAAMLPAQEDGK